MDTHAATVPSPAPRHIGGATSSTPAAPRWLLYLLIGSLPFCDFLQTGIVAFSAAPVMGDIGASPEEYSAVATLYAVVAIGVIGLHRRLVEAIGWRRLVLGSSLLFAAGAVVCGMAETLGGFALGRAVMALGCASFMTAARMLVNHIPPSPRRFTGIKFLASGLAWGVVAGPLVASAALSLFNWRTAFFVLPLPAAWMAALCLRVFTAVPAPRAANPQRASLAALLPVAALMGGSFFALHALQRSGFDFFNTPVALLAGAACALPVLALFLRLNRRQPRPLIAWQPLLQRRYLMGLGVFGLAYLVLGANNMLFPVLLQKVLGLPLETIGHYLGLGALASVATWIVLARLLPRHPGPTPYYLAGCAALMFCGYRLMGLSESANPLRAVLPALLCNGVFVIAVLSTTAMQTFQTVQHDDTALSHANQLKNMVQQFGIAAGTALATLFMQWRSSVHYTRLGESLSPTNLALPQTLARLAEQFTGAQDGSTAARMALAQLGQWVTQEATLMAANDYFLALFAFAATCAGCVVLAWMWRKLPSLAHAQTRA